MRKPDAVVTIDNDPLTLGDAATREDVAQYAERLQAHLSAEYDCTVEVRPTNGCLRPRCSDRPEIESYVRWLYASDGWQQFLV